MCVPAAVKDGHIMRNPAQGTAGAEAGLPFLIGPIRFRGEVEAFVGSVVFVESWNQRKGKKGIKMRSKQRTSVRTSQSLSSNAHVPTPQP